MKKRWPIVLAVAIIIVTVVSAFSAVEIYTFSAPVASKKPFFVGVTYCGNSTAEAEQLIDRVKNYTNLFVLQSGPLMSDLNATEQICDYAVNAGLYVIIYYGTSGSPFTLDSLLNEAQTRWGSHFLGLYYQDEPGGKMLDTGLNLSNGNQTITKNIDGSVSIAESSDSNDSQLSSSFSDVTFSPSGTIMVSKFETLNIPSNQTTMTINGTTTVTVPYTMEYFVTVYFLNGTISYQLNIGNEPTLSLIYQPDGIVQYQNGTVATNEGSISQFEPYQKLWDSRPLQTYAEAASLYVGNEQQVLGSIGNQTSIKLFTSDYGLYWFDYQGGYDSVFAELFGAQTDAVTLALVRGAADMQGKSWGVMIEWGNRTSIALQNVNQIYNEMRKAYQSGATYDIVFNYSPSGNGTGLLQNSDFAALEKFWKDVVQNPHETNNVVGQDALVLPNDYGGGMRSQNDTIWGFWSPDNNSMQIWNALEASLAKYGSKLDIVYDDPAYPSAGRYQHVVYWNQTI
jgi:hypothetical protein